MLRESPLHLATCPRHGAGHRDRRDRGAAGRRRLSVRPPFAAGHDRPHGDARDRVARIEELRIAAPELGRTTPADLPAAQTRGRHRRQLRIQRLAVDRFAQSTSRASAKKVAPRFGAQIGGQQRPCRHRSGAAAVGADADRQRALGAALFRRRICSRIAVSRADVGRLQPKGMDRGAGRHLGAQRGSSAGSARSPSTNSCCCRAPSSVPVS